MSIPLFKGHFPRSDGCPLNRGSTVLIDEGSQSSFVQNGKTGDKKRATCHATLLQNELNSDVAHFTTHIKPVLQQIRLLTGLNPLGGKRATTLFNSFCSDVA